jgi:hypothetical protein
MAVKPKPKKMSSKLMKKTKGGAGMPLPSVEAPPRTRTGSVGSNPPANMPKP